jgi:hypothetical protein
VQGLFAATKMVNAGGFVGLPYGFIKRLYDLCTLFAARAPRAVASPRPPETPSQRLIQEEQQTEVLLLT